MNRVSLALVLTAALAAPSVAQSPESPFGLVPGAPPGLVQPRPDGSIADDGDAAAEKSDLEGRGQGGVTAAERRVERLDRMFDQLAAADSKGRADRIARHILRRLERSGSDTVDLLMERAGAAMEKQNFGLALDLLDGVVRMEPGFAEGWNRRATANFLAGNIGQSVADIEQTLRYEPRHWGALLGLSMILVSMERNEDALAMMDRALAVHPFLEELKERRERLSREVAAEL